MGMSERQKMYDHFYELRSLSMAVAAIYHARGTARVNPIFRQVEVDALTRLYEAARDVEAFIDPENSVCEKPDLRNHFTAWPGREHLDWHLPAVSNVH